VNWDKIPAKTPDEFTETNTVVFVKYLLPETDPRLTHGFDFSTTGTTVTTTLRSRRDPSNSHKTIFFRPVVRVMISRTGLWNPGRDISCASHRLNRDKRLHGKPAAYITLPKLAFSLPAGGSRPAIRQPWATGPRGNSV
jgi:hypothetical protein